MGRQGEGGGLKILKNEEMSFMDDPLCIIRLNDSTQAEHVALQVKRFAVCVVVHICFQPSFMKL